MIAVLVASKKAGSSSWTAVRSKTRVCVSGAVEGDFLRLVFRDKEMSREFALSTNSDGEFEIPSWSWWVRAEHIESGPGSSVSVDLR